MSAKKFNNLLSKSGFTLIELIIVMALIGVLIGIAIGGIALANRGTRDTQRRIDLNGIRLAIEQCKTTVGAYPTAVTNQLSTTASVFTVGGSAYACGNTINLNSQGVSSTLSFNAVTGVCTNKTVTASTSSATTFGYEGGSGTAFGVCAKLEDGSTFVLVNS